MTAACQTSPAGLRDGVKAQGANLLGPCMPIIQLRKYMVSRTRHRSVWGVDPIGERFQAGGHAINKKMAVPVETSDGHWQLQT